MEIGLAVQVLTVVGLVAGPLLATHISNLAQERRERERAHRDHDLWIRDQKEKVYIALLEAIGKIIDEAKRLQMNEIPRVGLWEPAKYLERLRVFGTPKIWQQLHADFASAAADVGSRGGVRYLALIEFNDKVTKAARTDLKVDLEVEGEGRNV